MTPVVLVHGGGLDGRCWDRVVAELAAPSLAVDLPGRGRHPAPLASVTLAASARSVVDDVEAAGFDEVVLVGHSLAGCTLPGVVAGLGPRVRHAVFVACTVPPDGCSAFDTLDPEIQALIVAAGPLTETPVMTGDLARAVLGDDLSPEELQWCVDRLVPEAVGLTTEPVSLARFDAPCTWLRTTADQIVPAAKQDRFAANLPGCAVVDIDAGHMCMVSRPVEVARFLDGISQAGGPPPAARRPGSRRAPPPPG